MTSNSNARPTWAERCPQSHAANPNTTFDIRIVNTFHLFPLLPTELRLEIWNFALRDDTQRRGVNFVDFVPFKESAPEPLPRTEAEQSENNKNEPPAEVEQLPNTTVTIRPLYNRSTHLIDSGLWSACFESREVMLARFRHVHPPLLRQTCRLYTTLTFGQADRAPRQCTIFPFRDIFVVSLPCLLSHVTNPLLSLKLPDGPVPLSLLEIRRFAIEYDHEMVRQPRDAEKLCRQLAEAISNLGPFRTLYLIDYKLRRSLNGVANQQKGNEKTYTASGGRYVEVRINCEWEYDRLCYMQRSYFSLAFVEEVKRYRARHVPDRWRPRWPNAANRNPSARLKVLAWEPERGR